MLLRIILFIRILLFAYYILCDSSEDNVISTSNGNNLDPCYDSITGHAQRCIPNFENVAYNKKVITTSTCGSPPMKYCIQTQNIQYKSGQGANKCQICDQSSSSSMHGSNLLTDLEETNQTCWISAPVYEPSQISNISFIISFGKKYELTYISLQFCTQLKPDSIGIFKSMDYGKSWIPFQFYSSDCKKVFNRPLKTKITHANEQEAICTDSHLQSSPFNLNRIGFSTLDGRPSFHDFDTSPVLQDWVTATDIKVVFTRLLSPSIYNNVQNFPNQTGNKFKKHNSRQSRSELFSQIHNLGYYYAAVSEIAVGGRCKCNGHASRCILNKEGKYQCDCKHNTAGFECERCLPFHYDRPWARATPRDANECVACDCNNHSNQCRFNAEIYKLSGGKKSGGVCINCKHNTAGRFCQYCKTGFYRDNSTKINNKNTCKACNCNNHSNKCRFNKELYLLSGRKSGGVCINCKHNTAGRFCHYCAEGFFRNFEYAISNRKACQECNCHMIGSSDKVCNQNTGQCKCKEGVTGLRCDRCKKGYQQTNSAIIPCIKIKDSTSLSTSTTTTTTTTKTTTTITTTSSTFTLENREILLPLNRDNFKENYKYYDSKTFSYEAEKNQCDFCKVRPQKLSLKYFCKNDIVFLVQMNKKKEFSLNSEMDILGKNLNNIHNYKETFNRFSARIINIYKNYKNIEVLEESTNKTFESDQISLWFAKADLECDCPRIKPYRKYLIMINDKNFVKLSNFQNSFNDWQKNSSYVDFSKSLYSNKKNSNNILIDNKTTIFEWRSDFAKRVKHILNQNCN